MEVKEYVFSSWEIYPRVFYFKRRLADLYSRFKKVTNAVPKRLRDTGLDCQLDALCSYLEQPPHVTIIGSRDLAPEDFLASTNVPERQPELSSPLTACTHIYICHADIGDINESGHQVTNIMYKHFSEVQPRSQDLCYLFIVLKTNGNESEDDRTRFCATIQEEIESRTGSSQHAVQILVGPMKTRLKTKVSDAIEKDIVERFQDIFTFFKRFVRNDNRISREEIIILKSEMVEQEIRGFLGNGPALADVRCHMKQAPFIDVVLQSLCSKVQCAAVSPMAIKYKLPETTCQELLEDIHFDEDLVKSVTQNTRYHLQKMENCIETGGFERAKKRSRMHVKSSKFDFILYLLQVDMTKTVDTAEKRLASMERITNVMRKMCFEIRGYLNQTNLADAEVTDDPGLFKHSTKDLTNELREEILRVEGVQAVGTLFGQLEIHLTKGSDKETTQNTKTELDNILCRHQFHHRYIIKSIDENAKTLAKCQYEQGDKLASPFPDNMGQYREGTLGCFARDENGQLFCLTCAHVVDPHNRKQHGVFVDIGKGRKRFGISTPQRILYSSTENLSLVDIAAVKIVNDEAVKALCNSCMRNEIGKPKSVRVAEETSHQLVGCDVYKYGATTGLTKGIIASTDLSCSSENPGERLIIIEPPPTVDDDDSLAENNIDSPICSREPTTVEKREMAVNDSGYSSLLDNSPDHNVKAASSEEIDRCLSEQMARLCEDSTFERSTEEANTSASMPRPETLDEIEPRDCETLLSRTLKKYPVIKTGRTSDFERNMFAAEGDSGAIVFMNDLKSDTIVILSMIIAGNYKVTTCGSQKSDTAKCFSFGLKKALEKLEQKCKSYFNLNFPR